MDTEEFRRLIGNMQIDEFRVLLAIVHIKLLSGDVNVSPEQIPQITKGECKRLIKRIRQGQMENLILCAGEECESVVNHIRRVWMRNG